MKFEIEFPRGVTPAQALGMIQGALRVHSLFEPSSPEQIAQAWRELAKDWLPQMTPEAQKTIRDFIDGEALGRRQILSQVAERTSSRSQS